MLILHALGQLFLEQKAQQHMVEDKSRAREQQQQQQ